MKKIVWLRLSFKAPDVVLAFIKACNEPDHSKRGGRIAEAIVGAYMLIEPLLGSKPGTLKVKGIVDEFLPQIAARFGA